MTKLLLLVVVVLAMSCSRKPFAECLANTDCLQGSTCQNGVCVVGDAGLALDATILDVSPVDSGGPGEVDAELDAAALDGALDGSQPAPDATPSGDALPEDAQPGIADAGFSDGSFLDAAPGQDAYPGPALEADGCPARVCYGGGAWCWETPRPAGLAATSLWASGSTDVYVIDDGTSLMRYGGIGWYLVADWPGQGWPGKFHIRGRAWNDFWVIGPHHAVHFDGNAFHEMADPGEVRDFWVAPSGIVFLANASPPYLAQYDGSRTRAIALPSSIVGAEKIWGTSESDVVAGVIGPGGSHYLAEERGSGWTVRPEVLPTTPESGWSKTSIDRWVLGYSYVQHDDGSGWRSLNVPQAYYHDGFGTGTDEVWIVGSQVLSGHGEQLSPRLAPSGHDYVRGFGIDSNDVWFAGKGVLGHWDGTVIAERSCGLPVTFRDVWVYSSTLAWAVGERAPYLGETVLKKEGDTWRELPLPPGTRSVRRIRPRSGPNDLFIVGDDTVLHYDGLTISTAVSPGTSRPPSGPWRDIGFFGAGQFFLFGASGDIALALDVCDRGGCSYLGANLSYSCDVGQAVERVPGEFWLACSNGIVIVWTVGSGFNSEHVTPMRDALLTIAKSSENLLWAGGLAGLFALTPAANGTLTSSVVPGVPGGVREIRAFADDDLWLVGDFGVGHYDGTRFQLVPVSDLPVGPVDAIDGTGARDLLIAAPNGLLHGSGP